MTSSSLPLAAVLLLTLGLVACDKPPSPVVIQVPAAPVAVPGPAGPTGASGSDGKQGAPGATGKAGESTTVIVAPPAAPAN